MATKTKDKPAPDIVKESFSRSLKIELNPDQVAERADRAAQMIAERDAKEEEHKAAAKHNKSVIESMDAEIRRLSNEVRTRSTYAPVDCERVIDYKANRIREMRIDTSELLADRNLTDAERQRDIFDGNGVQA